MPVAETSNALEALAKQSGRSWPSLARARNDSVAARRKLETLLIESGERFIGDDSSFVVFGSLGRDEWTIKSDLDWTFLVDGQADPEHLSITQDIAQLLKDNGFGPPGPTGVFGNMAFSHEIIH